MSKPTDPPASPDPLTAFPAQLKHSTEHPQRVYQRAADLYAVQEDEVVASAPAEQSLRTDDGHRVAIHRCAPGAAPRGAQAVYVEAAGGQRMVPSGRVFVRFADTVKAESRRALLLAAGFRITALPSYARHAAWLEADDRVAAHALAGVSRLEALPDVENVEPQWLGARQAR